LEKKKSTQSKQIEKRKEIEKKEEIHGRKLRGRDKILESNLRYDFKI